VIEIIITYPTQTILLRSMLELLLQLHQNQYFHLCLEFYCSVFILLVIKIIYTILCKS